MHYREGLGITADTDRQYEEADRFLGAVDSHQSLLLKTRQQAQRTPKEKELWPLTGGDVTGLGHSTYPRDQRWGS